MRIILKISGEALKEEDNNVSEKKLKMVLETVKLLKQKDNLIAIVIGGGNFFRGREHEDMQKVNADTIGMLGTVMNALYLKDYFYKHNIDCLISTPFSFPDLIANYEHQELNALFEQGKVIIFGGGIGKSGYSTDSGIVLAKDILKADLIIKLTNVDGVYMEDPKVKPDAKKFSELTYQDVITQNLGVMDLYAIKECAKTHTQILVMNFLDYPKINEFFNGAEMGTLIKEEI